MNGARTHSCLYEGVVRHQRFSPFRHEFRYRLFLAYLDLSELDRVFHGSRLWSTSKRALAEFRRSDHLGDAARPLDECVRDLVQQRIGRRPAGPVRLLTHLRYFGYVMNPVSFYYCFDPAGEEVEAVVAEVNNTPWGERHCYVLDRSECDTSRMLKRSHAKDFHVSPFLPMDMEYRWALSTPGERLLVHIDDCRNGEPDLRATLLLKRRTITPLTLATTLARYPLMTAKVIAAIYWQALRLWWKEATYHPHPKTLETQIAPRHSTIERVPQS
jgi:DUF1365 family protein